MTVLVDQPGVYDLTDAAYHADPVPAGSLSSSGARKLLPPNCPAKFAYERANPPTPTAAFDIGHAAHRHVLGVGAPLVVVDAVGWRTKAAQQARIEAHAGGAVPLLTEQYRRVQAMAAAIEQHPLASALLRRGEGQAEQSLFWLDGETGVWRRARIDWLGRYVVDYKSCDSAEKSHVRRAAYNYGYHQQAPWYLDGVAALDLLEDPAFLFVFQEKAPPYLVNIIELDAEALEAGRALNRRAIEIYRDCTATDTWPGYADEVELVSLPPWATKTEEYAQ